METVEAAPGPWETHGVMEAMETMEAVKVQGTTQP